MLRTVCGFFLILVLIPWPLWSAPLSARLQSVLTTAVEPVPVIVRLKSMDARARVQGMSRRESRQTLVANLKQQARQSGGPLAEFLRQQGVPNPKSLWLINGLAFSASPQLIAQLASWPEVELISVDQTVPRPIIFPAAVAGVEWNIDMIGAPQVWAQAIDGSGVVVASLDTGVDVDHPDLSGNWRGGSNSWFDPYENTMLPYDPVIDDPSMGHGTAVMGVLVGGSAGGSAIGVAPGAQWIAAKIFPDIGDASNSIILDALGWVLDPDGNPLSDDGADVVNNSWGFDNFLDQCLEGRDLTDYQVALANLRAAGVAVVFSAGNTGPQSGSSIPPGNMSGVLATGAVDIRADVADFSARGPSPCDAVGDIFPSLTAPGVGIRSAGLTQHGISIYVTVDGTSFSAPHVAGALALLRQAFPTRGVAELETAIQETTFDLGAPGDDDDYGSGLLDVAAAYSFLLAPPTPILSLPENTAISVERPVAFSWHRDADPDGDTVIDYLLISVSGDFSGSIPITTGLSPAALMLAGGFCMLGLWRRRKKRGWCLLPLVVLLSLLQLSCGGGGSAASVPVPLVDTGEYLHETLEANTTYYWKIRSENSRGGISESAVWTFTTL